MFRLLRTGPGLFQGQRLCPGSGLREPGGDALCWAWRKHQAGRPGRVPDPPGPEGALGGADPSTSGEGTSEEGQSSDPPCPVRVKKNGAASHVGWGCECSSSIAGRRVTGSAPATTTCVWGRTVSPGSSPVPSLCAAWLPGSVPCPSNLSCSQLFTVMNKSTTGISSRLSVGKLFLFLLSGILGHKVGGCLTLQTLPSSFPKRFYHFTHSPAQHELQPPRALANTGFCLYLQFYLLGVKRHRSVGFKSKSPGD